MNNVALSLLVLKTRQLDGLRRFYGSLGIELTKEQHGKGPVHYAARVGDVVLEVYPLPDNDTSADATTRLGFAVPSVAKVVQALQAVGTPIVREPQVTQWGLQAVVRDPDGRAVELYEH